MQYYLLSVTEKSVHYMECSNTVFTRVDPHKLLNKWETFFKEKKKNGNRVISLYKLLKYVS